MADQKSKPAKGQDAKTQGAGGKGEPQKRKKIMMQSPRSIYSQPVMHRDVELFSMQAQKIAEQSLNKVAYSLFSIEVILQIIGERDKVNEVENLISDDIATADEELLKELERLKVLKEKAGITDDKTPHYSHPATVTLAITSPLILHFAGLLKKLDVVMIHIDTLWLQGQMHNQQRVDANFVWQKRIQRLSSRIITIETRARKQAYRMGKKTEVDSEAPKQEDKEAPAAPTSENARTDTAESAEALSTTGTAVAADADADSTEKTAVS